jgi:hypothetical protein
LILSKLPYNITDSRWSQCATQERTFFERRTYLIGSSWQSSTWTQLIDSRELQLWDQMRPLPWLLTPELSEQQLYHNKKNTSMRRIGAGGICDGERRGARMMEGHKI